MCFTDSMRKKILSKGDVKEKDILKMVSVEWRKLSEKDKAFWDEEARNDKVRYVRTCKNIGVLINLLTVFWLCLIRFVKEKAEYKGPWIVPKRRARKNPLAPKRPMSAFLKYSQVCIRLRCDQTTNLYFSHFMFSLCCYLETPCVCQREQPRYE